MNFQFTSISRISTLRLIVLAFGLVIVAISCDAAQRLIWPYSKSLAHVLDHAAAIIGWTGIGALGIGIMAGPFRPIDRFSLYGECRQRAINFGVALLGLILFGFYQALLVAWLLFY